MNITKFFSAKSPGDHAPYSFDFTNWLNKASDDGSIPADTITGTPIITTSDVALQSSSVVNNGKIVTCVLSGGTAPNTYTVSCQVTTALGITAIRSATIQVLNR